MERAYETVVTSLSSHHPPPKQVSEPSPCQLSPEEEGAEPSRKKRDAPLAPTYPVTLKILNLVYVQGQP